MYVVAPGAGRLEEHLKNPSSIDLFGSSDSIVKHVLEVCTYICVGINFCGCVKIIFVMHLMSLNQFYTVSLYDTFCQYM